MKKRVIWTVLAVLVIFAVVIAAIIALLLMKKDVQSEEGPREIITVDEVEERLSTEGFNGAFTLLVIGSDSREGQRVNDGEESELNDVTMLVKVNAQHDRADLVSFPRDAMISMNSCSASETSGELQQLNSALTIGGGDCVKSSIEELTGEPVNGTALVSFNAVEELTEAVGGVPVCVAEPVYDADTGNLLYDKGQVNLSGEGALRFVRERHAFGDGSDLGRIYNQQVFVKAFLKEFRQSNFITDPIKFWKLSDATMSNLELSSELNNPAELLKLMNTFLSVPESNYQFYTAPVTDYPNDPNRLSIDSEQLQALLAYINTGTVSEHKEEPVVTEEPASDEEVIGSVSSGQGLSSKPGNTIPVKPETLPQDDLYAPRSGDDYAISVCA